MSQRRRLPLTSRVVACALALPLLFAGCGFRDPSTIAPVTKAVGGVVDTGAVDLPNRPGYKLRVYEVLREHQNTHFVYVIEKDDIPVAGTGVRWSQGKHSVSASSVVEVELPPRAQPQRCDSVSSCEQALERLSAQQPPATCATPEQCERQLQALRARQASH